jgi:integrase
VAKKPNSGVQRTKTRGGPWNKGTKVGPRDAFTPAEVRNIRRTLQKRGEAGLRDLALFSTAIDTMLHASDLLALTVRDVRQRNGTMRDLIELQQPRGKSTFKCTLSKGSMEVLDAWIKRADKKPNDHLFTGQTNKRASPMTVRQLGRLVKAWAEGVGLKATTYGTETLRRSRAMHILNETGDMETVRALLGHTTITSTARYLGAIKRADPLEISRAYEI